MKIQKILFIAFALCAVSLGGQRAHAQSVQEYAQCGADDSANALLSLPAGSYDIYAKLNIKNITEVGTVYSQDLSLQGTIDGCRTLGSKSINDKTYTKIASGVAFSEDITVIYLTSPNTSSMQSAAATQLIFVASGKDICDFASECGVVYKGETMNLSPKKISLSSDSLRIGLLMAATDDAAVKKVIYSIDGKPVYETARLEPFNNKYVSGGEHTLGRRVIFESGVSLSDSKVIERGTIADLNYVFQSIFFGQSKLIKIVLVFVGILMIWSIVALITKAIHRRRVWHQTHVASASGYTIEAGKTGAQKNFYDESMARTAYRYRKWFFALLGMALGFIVVTTYIVGSFTVDGVSMFPTLQDKSVRPLIKFQKTIATINKSQYVPKRGDIVVVQKDDNNLFDPEAALHKSYVVKRTVALPGERVTVKNGKILVYNSENKEGFEPDALYKWTSELEGSEQFNIDITLKDSELFVVGDHRDESIDSRFYGPIDTKEVIGKVVP